MGRARSFRQLGNRRAAQELCSSWKARLNEIGAGLNSMQWPGEDLASARWKLSCGDFQTGLKEVREIANRDASSNKQMDPYQAAAPYHVLEIIYHAHGETRMAQLAKDSADRVIAARSSAILTQVMRDAGALFEGSSVH